MNVNFNQLEVAILIELLVHRKIELNGLGVKTETIDQIIDKLREI